MIKVNEHIIEYGSFPDGTSAIRCKPYVGEGIYEVEWRYDDDRECMILWYLVHHLRSHDPNAQFILHLPYVPNARIDRVKNDDEVFTLKWFAEFINSLGFKHVYITDPHSNVSPALIDRAVVLNVIPHVTDALAHIIAKIGPIDRQILLCYPDEGASKKYTDQFPCMEYVFGIKHRDWRTGRIERLVLHNSGIVADRDVLIVDDICSRGGTFIHTAKALREAGAKRVFLYITHCENTIYSGDVLTSDLIEHVYTTNSIYRGDHDRITVLRRPYD